MGDMLQEKTWSHCLSIPAVDNSETYALASSAASDSFDCNKMLACICRTAAISAPLQACQSILSTSVTVQQLCERPDCPLSDCNDEEYPSPGLPACDLLSPLTSCCDPCPPKATQGTAEPKQHLGADTGKAAKPDYQPRSCHAVDYSTPRQISVLEGSHQTLPQSSFLRMAEAYAPCLCM